MSRWRWSLLIFVLGLFVLILVLPQVDLPDFTFQRGSAPIVARLRVSPPALTVVRVQNFSELPHEFRAESPQFELLYRRKPPSLLSQLCFLLC